MKIYILILFFAFNSLLIAKDPCIWITNDYSLNLTGDVLSYVESIIKHIKSDYKDDVGDLKGYFNFGTDSDASKHYSVSSPNPKMKVKTGDMIIHFSGITVNCESKINAIFINYFVVDGCNLWAWVTYNNTLFYSEQPDQCEQALNEIYEDINRRIKVYYNQKKMNE